MKEHKFRLIHASENYDYGGCDFYHWCENCGLVKKVPGRIDKETIFYIPVGYGSKPNSQECIGEEKL
jgi:hypothetical protein